MAEVAIDDRRLLKTMRWWDGFVIGLANPGFLLAGLGASTGALGAKWASIIWFTSAIIGALQAYVYVEPATMFPDKPGGLSVYAKEGWRKYFSLAGPIATFGYWFAWSSVLAIYGGIIGTLLVARFWTDLDADGANTNSFGSWHTEVIGVQINTVRIIASICILACWTFNVRGMRPAVWFSYVTGAMMVIPVLVLAFGPYVTGHMDYSLGGSAIHSYVTGVYGDQGTAFNSFAFAMVWLWVIGWSTYGPEAPASFAPEFKDTKNDTRLAIMSTGALNVVLSLFLPIAIVGTLGYAAISGDLTYISFIATALDTIAGDTIGGLLVLFICAGLLLSMNTATMDGSRALYGMAREGLTVKQLDHLNKHSVPSRAMTLDLVLNLCLVFFFPSIFFVLAAGNIGYVLSHVLALSGVLLLRKDRPNWPRPLKLSKLWMVLAGVFCFINLFLTIFGIIWIKYTGYLFQGADPTGYVDRAIITGVAALVVGVAGYVIAQHQHGKKFRWTDPSTDEPAPEVYDLMKEQTILS